MKIKKKILTVEYELAVEDPNAPITNDYIGILGVKNDEGEQLKLRHEDTRMLETVLIKIYHHSKV